MGGTSFDVALCIDGAPAETRQTNLGFRIPVRVPMIDIQVIGAGVFGPDDEGVARAADDPERMVLYFATVGHDFEVIEPPEVAAAVAAVAARLHTASRGTR